MLISSGSHGDTGLTDGLLPLVATDGLPQLLQASILVGGGSVINRAYPV